jgi:hypothetical protein
MAVTMGMRLALVGDPAGGYRHLFVDLGSVVEFVDAVLVVVVDDHRIAVPPRAQR